MQPVVGITSTNYVCKVFGGEVGGQVVSYLCVYIYIREYNIHRQANLRSARDANRKEFYPILVFNSPRESTQLHKSSNPRPHASCVRYPITACTLVMVGRMRHYRRLIGKSHWNHNFNLKKSPQKKKQTFPQTRVVDFYFVHIPSPALRFVINQLMVKKNKLNVYIVYKSIGQKHSDMLTYK